MLGALYCYILYFEKSDFTKKASELTGEVSKQAKQAAEAISKQTQEFSKTATYKAVSEVILLHKTLMIWSGS